jgi:hypothetical protein
MSELLPFEVKEFDGGLTDDYVDSAPNTFARGDNLSIGADKKPFTRPGSVAYSETAYRPVAARVGAMINLNNDGDLIAQSDKKLYYVNAGGAWAELVGPSSNSAFSSGDTTNVISSAQWRGMLYLASDALPSVMRVYRDGANLKIRNAGLPAPTGTPAISGALLPFYVLADDIGKKLNAHGRDLTQHVLADPHFVANWDYVSRYEYSIIGLQRFCEYLSGYWVGGSGVYGHQEDAAEVSGWTYHKGKENPTNEFAVDTTTIANIVTTLNTAKAKLNAHDNDSAAHNAVGLHQITAPNVTDPGMLIADYGQALYAFAYSYTYSSGGVTYEDVGPPIFVTAFDVRLNQETINMTGLPVLANGLTENYDTASIKLKIFRTTNNGTVLYYAGEVTNGTTTYSDSLKDVRTTAWPGIKGAEAVGLTDNALLYTTGGVLDNDPPPPSKYVHIVNNIGYYGHVKELGITYPNRFRQSVPNDPDSCPTGLYGDVEDEITGVKAAKSRPIILCKKFIYRIDGAYDELGKGTVVPEEISKTAGCVSNESCVETKDGLFWVGIDGFYFTDGYNVIKISEGLDTTHATITSTTTKQKRIKGSYISKYNVILWTAQYGAGSDNDAVFCLHLNHGIRPRSVFTTWSGVGFDPTAICEFAGNIVRATKDGYIFKHAAAYKTDPKVGAGAPSTWSTLAIIWDYISPCFSFGTDLYRKFVPRITLSCANEPGLAAQINSFNDKKAAGKPLFPIRFTGTGIMKQWARFPAGGLRCDYKQVQITNAYTYIAKSDSLGLATTSSSNDRYTAIIPGDFTGDLIGQFFYLDSAPTVGHEITAQSTHAIDLGPYVAQTLGTGLKWHIKGYPKGKNLKILNYILHYFPIGKTQPTADGTTGGNA